VGRVFDYLHRELEGGPLHLTLIDPDKSPGGMAAEIAEAAVGLGSHAILLGGSTGITPEVMGAAATAIRERVPVPTIIFPEGPRSLTPEADAVFFMSLLNSRNLDLVIRAHARAAPIIRKMNLEPLSLGYLVIAPGMRVGEIGDVDAIDRADVTSAEGFALAAELLGMRFVYLEAGSGAPSPVPAPMITAVRSNLSIPLIVGGGIRSGADARGVLDAGAQILVTGTVTETEGVGSNFRGVLAEVGRDRGR
jgi:phosphoglycerol geranylgeranyltransferase